MGIYYVIFVDFMEYTSYCTSEYQHTFGMNTMEYTVPVTNHIMCQNDDQQFYGIPQHGKQY